MDILKAEIAAKKRKKEASILDDNKISCESSRDAGAASAAQKADNAEKRLKLDGREGILHTGNAEGEAWKGDGAVKDVRDENPNGLLRAMNGAETATFSISNEEAVRRLRAKGEPICLFGECDKDRRLRLRALELIEQRGESMGQNDFLRAMKGAESTMLNRELANPKAERDKKSRTDDGQDDGEEDASGSRSATKRDGVGMDSLLDLSLIKRDISKVYPIIYYTLKGLVQDWEQTLADRPVDVRQSNQGKLVAATQVQTAEYLKPLFKQLRHRSVKPDVLARLAEIIHYVQKREYRHANDSYLQLSIGNAPWPIGVTMVGIHERSGREKIFSSNVAHALNDEVSRKYIQSLKRLMTFAQTKYPPANVSMLMG